jgi:pyrroline-5-carboxylate reductase
MLSKGDKTIDEIIAGVTTPGGITEQLNQSLQKADATTAWKDGLDDLIDKNK